MEASIAGCDDQLVHLRSVPCEMRPENIFQIYDEQRLVGEDADLYHNGDICSALYAVLAFACCIRARAGQRGDTLKEARRAARRVSFVVSTRGATHHAQKNKLTSAKN
jgi:hypothetical protein